MGNYAAPHPAKANRYRSLAPKGMRAYPAAMASNILDTLGSYHALLVHFPVALIIVGGLMQLICCVRPQEWLRTTARVNLLLGALAVIPAIVSGKLREERWGEIPALEVHERWGYALLAWALAYIAVRLWRPVWLQKDTPAALWGIAGVLLAAITGHMGSAIIRGG
jgi:uncharacterized membrane protein